MTKAAFLDEHGGPENFILRNYEPPAPGPGQIQLRHTAIGLNFIDIYQRKGLYPVELPAILGSEAAGVVEATGEGVTGFAAGDRVVCLHASHAYAERANGAAMMCAKIPDNVGDDQAAAIFVKGLTAEMLVRQVYLLKEGETCLVHAAAGGVGTLLCQWAKHIGARVIAVVGSPEKEGIARQHGADDIIIRTQIDNISTEVRRLTDGKGVAVVYDSVGAATFEASLDSLAARGHMVSFGNASGPAPAIAPLELMRRGSLSLTRPSLFHYATPERLPAMAERLFQMVAKGALKPKIDHRFPLSDVAGAHALLESGKSTGAILINP